MSYEVITLPNSGNLRHGRLSIAVSNLHVPVGDIFGSATGTPNLSEDRHERITRLLNYALESRHHIDLIILPEVSVPHSYLGMMQRYCRQHQIGLIFGMEHRLIRHQKPLPTDLGTAYNHVVTLLPCRRGDVLHECHTHVRLKRHYAPGETEELQHRRVAIPVTTPRPYPLFHWRNTYFTVFNCYELANVTARAQFRSKIDLMVAVEWNLNTNYFSNIAEGTARDLHCYFAQVNTAQYGDSRIIQPSKTDSMNLLRTKGGKNEALLIHEIDISGLRAFQSLAISGQMTDDRFKCTPPDFDLSQVERRIANLPPQPIQPQQ